MAKKSKTYRGQRVYREACKTPCGCFYCTGHSKEDLQHKKEIEADKEIINNVSLYGVSTFLKCGWVVEFDNEWIECLLRKDYELDEELTLERGLLTEEQNKMVSLGQIVRYDKKTKSVQFLLEDGINWC